MISNPLTEMESGSVVVVHFSIAWRKYWVRIFFSFTIIWLLISPVAQLCESEHPFRAFTGCCVTKDTGSFQYVSFSSATQHTRRAWWEALSQGSLLLSEVNLETWGARWPGAALAGLPWLLEGQTAQLSPSPHLQLPSSFPPSPDSPRIW